MDPSHLSLSVYSCLQMFSSTYFLESRAKRAANMHIIRTVADGAKELFFRHLLAMTSIDKAAFGWKLPVQLFLSFAYTDVYMELVPGPLSWYVTHGVGGIAKRVGPWVGLRPFYEEYTPVRLKGIAAKAEGKIEKEE